MINAMKKQIQQILTAVLASMGISGVVPAVSVPENPAHGDYSTNVAMVLFRHPNFPNLPKFPKSPKEFAEKLKNAIVKDQTISDAGIIERVEVAGPGFLNLYLSEASLINRVSEVLKKQDTYGSVTKTAKIVDRRTKIVDSDSKKSEQKQREKIGEKPDMATGSQIAKKPVKISRINTARDSSARQKATGAIPSGPEIIPEGIKKRVMVEFTDPNPFKELHIGHLYSNAVGESLSRLYEAVGWEVKRADYFGDVGMHVAKSIWGMKKLLGDEKRSLRDIEGLSCSERIHWLGRAYSLGSTAYEGEHAKDEVKKDIHQFNLLVYVAAQEYMAKTHGWAPVVDYRGLLTPDALSMLPAVRELFEKGREWSMAYFESIFARLGTKFDYYYPESIVGEYGAKIVREHAEVFTKSDGAIIFEGEKVGLHNRVFVNSVGLPTYETKELGLNYKKYQDFPFDLSLIVTGKEINEYFRVLFAAMERVIPEVAAKTKHIGHGMVRLPQGKMSSRTGKVITAEWLLDEAKKSIYKILDRTVSSSRSSSPQCPLVPLVPRYSSSEKDEIAEKAAIAAIKYSFLRVNISSDISFDIEASVSFEGDSGPYLQYTYARCKSVLRKSDKEQGTSDKQSKEKMNPEERTLARSIMQFPDVVAEAAQNFSPNTICTYLFHLAQEFNLFYAKHPIIGNNLRLALTAATAQVINNGLYLLGIETMEKM